MRNHEHISWKCQSSETPLHKIMLDSYNIISSKIFQNVIYLHYFLSDALFV